MQYFVLLKRETTLFKLLTLIILNGFNSHCNSNLIQKDARTYYNFNIYNRKELKILPTVAFYT